MNARTISKRIITDDVAGTIVMKDADKRTFRITPLLVPAGRIKIIGVVDRKSRVGNDEFGVMYIDDIFGQTKIFIPDENLTNKMDNIRTGDVVQVVGKLVQNSVNGRVEIIAEAFSKVPDEVYIHHLIKYNNSLEDHMSKVQELNEYFKLKEELSKKKLEKDIDGVRAIKKKLLALETIIGKDYIDTITMYEVYIMHKLMEEEFFDDEEDDKKEEKVNDTKVESTEDIIDDEEYDENFEIDLEDEEDPDTIYI